MERVFPTEDFLEADKLVATLKAFIYENYRVPIVCLELPGHKRYVIDGHHRLLVHRLFNQHVIRSFILIPEKSIWDLGTISMPIARMYLPYLNAEDASILQDDIRC
ncbi:MAG: hypothetical protein ACUVQ0_02540 [Thermoproteota archaeon]